LQNPLPGLAHAEIALLVYHRAIMLVRRLPIQQIPAGLTLHGLDLVFDYAAEDAQEGRVLGSHNGTSPPQDGH